LRYASGDLLVEPGELVGHALRGRRAKIGHCALAEPLSVSITRNILLVDAYEVAATTIEIALQGPTHFPFAIQGVAIGPELFEAEEGDLAAQLRGVIVSDAVVIDVEENGAFAIG
jgi:hypothetical protein